MVQNNAVGKGIVVGSIVTIIIMECGFNLRFALLGGVIIGSFVMVWGLNDQVTTYERR